MELRPTRVEDAEGVADLQRECFPEPFPADQLFQPKHILSHLAKFPEAQWVVTDGEVVVASCTNMLVSSQAFDDHWSWEKTTGGLALGHHNQEGTVLYGVDISVHPRARRLGLARRLYQARLDWASQNGKSYGTVCRLPGFHSSGFSSPVVYVEAAVRSEVSDPVLTPLLALGLHWEGVVEDYMEDEESGNAGAILKWKA